MTHTIQLKERRAQVVVKEMNNATKIISQPDEDGWVKIEIAVDSSWDALQLFHAGMSAQSQLTNEHNAGVFA